MNLEDHLLEMSTMVHPFYYYEATCGCGHRFTYGTETKDENRTHCNQPCVSKLILTQEPGERRDWYFGAKMIKEMAK